MNSRICETTFDDIEGKTTTSARDRRAFSSSYPEPNQSRLPAINPVNDFSGPNSVNGIRQTEGVPVICMCKDTATPPAVLRMFPHYLMCHCVPVIPVVDVPSSEPPRREGGRKLLNKGLLRSFGILDKSAHHGIERHENQYDLCERVAGCEVRRAYLDCMKVDPNVPLLQNQFDVLKAAFTDMELFWDHEEFEQITAWLSQGQNGRTPRCLSKLLDQLKEYNFNFTLLLRLSALFHLRANVPNVNLGNWNLVAANLSTLVLALRNPHGCASTSAIRTARASMGPSSLRAQEDAPNFFQKWFSTNSNPMAAFTACVASLKSFFGHISQSISRIIGYVGDLIKDAVTKITEGISNVVGDATSVFAAVRWVIYAGVTGLLLWLGLTCLSVVYSTARILFTNNTKQSTVVNVHQPTANPDQPLLAQGPVTPWALFIVGLSGVVGLSTLDQADYNKSMRTVLSTFAVATIGAASFETIFSLLPVAASTALILKAGTEEQRNNLRIKPWIERANNVVAFRSTPSVMTSKEFHEVVSGMVKEGTEIRNMSMKSDSAAPFSKAFSDLMQILANTTALMSGDDPAQTPFSVHLAGPGGLGKSIMKEKFFLDAFDIDAHAIYDVSTTSGYWSTFIPSRHRGLMWDEFCNTKDPTASALQTDDYMLLVGPSKFRPDFASIDNPLVGIKGTSVDPEVVVTVSNDLYPEGTARHTDAFHRRRNLVFWMSTDIGLIEKRLKEKMKSDPEWKYNGNPSLRQDLDLSIFTQEDFQTLSWMRFTQCPKINEREELGESISYEEMIALTKSLHRGFKHVCEEIKTIKAEAPSALTAREILASLGCDLYMKVVDSGSDEEVLNTLITANDPVYLQALKSLYSKATDAVSLITALVISPTAQGGGKKNRNKPKPPPRPPSSVMSIASEPSEYASDHDVSLTPYMSSCSPLEVEQEPRVRRPQYPLFPLKTDLTFRNYEIEEGWVYLSNNGAGRFRYSPTNRAHTPEVCEVLANLDPIRPEDKKSIFQKLGPTALMSMSILGVAVAFKAAIYLKGLIHDQSPEEMEPQPMQAQTEDSLRRHGAKKVNRVRRTFQMKSAQAMEPPSYRVDLCFNGLTVHAIPIGEKKVFVHAHAFKDNSGGWSVVEGESIMVKLGGRMYAYAFDPRDAQQLISSSNDDLDLLVLDMASSRTLPCFKNISKHFIDECDLDSFSRVPCRVENNNREKGTAVVKENETYSTIADSSGHSKLYNVDIGWAMPGKFNSGDCGSPWIGMFPGGRNKLLGMHVAGINGKYGFAIVLTKEMAELALSIPEVDPEVISHEPVVAQLGPAKFDTVEAYEQDVMQHITAITCLWACFPDLHDVLDARTVSSHDKSKLDRSSLEFSCYRTFFHPPKCDDEMYALNKNIMDRLCPDPRDPLTDQMIADRDEMSISSGGLSTVEEIEKIDWDTLDEVNRRDSRDSAVISAIFKIGCILHYQKNDHHPQTWDNNGPTRAQALHRVLDMMACTWRTVGYQKIRVINLLGQVKNSQYLKQGKPGVEVHLRNIIREMQCMDGSAKDVVMENWEKLALTAGIGTNQIEPATRASTEMTYHMCRKTKLQKSTAHKIFQREFPDQEDRGPAVLDKGDTRTRNKSDPAFKAIWKLGSTNIQGLKDASRSFMMTYHDRDCAHEEVEKDNIGYHVDLQVATNELTADLQRDLVWPIKTTLSMQEAICGIPGFMKELNLETSAGHPLAKMATKPGKKSEITIVYRPDHWVPRVAEVSDNVTMRLKEMLDHLVNGAPQPEPIMIAYLKDELRSDKKISDNDTRLIYSGNMIMNIAARMLFGSIYSAINTGSRNTPIAIGYNQLSNDMQSIFDYLNQVRPAGYIAGDMKNFDMNSHPEIRAASYKILGDLWAENTEKLEMVVEGTSFKITDSAATWNRFVDMQNNVSVIMGDHHLTFKNAHYSGLLFTTPVNCLSHALMWRMFYHSTWTGKPRHVGPYRDNVRDKFLGDDNLVGPSLQTYKDGFTPRGFQTYVAGFGQRYTSDTKSAELTDDLRDFSDITFLGAHPRVLMDGSWTGAMRKTTLENSPRWTRNNDMTLREEMEVILDMASQWDEDYYKKILVAVNKVKQGQLSLPPGRNDYHERQQRNAKLVGESSESFPWIAQGDGQGTSNIVSIEEAEEMVRASYERVNSPSDPMSLGNLNMEECLNTAIRWGEFKWAATNPIGTELFRYDLPFSGLGIQQADDIQARILRMFALWRGDTVFITQIHGTPFFSGAIMNYFRPLTNESVTGGLDYTRGTALTHTVLTPCGVHTSVLTVPYCSDYALTPTTAVGNVNGYVRWVTRAPLQFGLQAGTASEVWVTVYICFRNNTMKIPRMTGMLPFGPRDYGAIGVERAQGPALSTLMPKTIEVDAMGIKGKVSMDRYAVGGSGVPVSIKTPSMAAVDHGLPASLMAWGVEDFNYHENDMRDLTLSELAAKPTIVGTFVVDLSKGTTSTPLWTVDLSLPFFSYTSLSSLAALNAPNVSVAEWVVDMARYWKGKMVFTVRAFKTKYHSFRLNAITQYMARTTMTNALSVAQISNLMDFSEENCVSAIEIDFIHLVEFLEVYKGGDKTWANSMGQLSIIMRDNLQSASTVSSSVLLDVEFSIKDLVLKAPSSCSLVATSSNVTTYTLNSTVAPAQIDATLPTLARRFFRKKKGLYELRNGVQKRFPDHYVIKLEDGAIDYVKVSTVSASDKIFPVDTGVTAQGDEGVHGQQQSIPEDEVTPAVPSLGTGALPRSTGCFNSILSMARRMRQFDYDGAFDGYKCEVTYSGNKKSDIDRSLSWVNAPCFGFERSFAGWSGAINWRITATARTTQTILVSYVPDPQRNSSPTTGYVFAALPGADMTLNNQITGGITISRKTTVARRFPNLSPIQIPLEITPGAAGLFNLDFSVPFEWPREFALTGEGTGVITVLCRGDDPISVFVSAGDSFRYLFWRCPTHLKVAGVSKAGSANVAFNAGALKFAPTAARAKRETILNDAVSEEEDDDDYRLEAAPSVFLKTYAKAGVTITTPCQTPSTTPAPVSSSSTTEAESEGGPLIDLMIKKKGPKPRP